MNKENLRKVVEALRSEKYQQGRGRLRRRDEYCAEGVICDLSGVAEWERRVGGCYVYDGMGGAMSVAVNAWLLGPDNYGCLSLHDEYDCKVTLRSLNDRGYDFHHLAALIEKEYEL